MQKSIIPILLILMVFLTSELVSGQSYVSFPDSNAVWCGQRGQLYFSPPNDQWHSWTYQQYISGDTTINGLLYHKVEESGVFDWTAYPIPTSSGSTPYFHQYIGCFREYNKVVYFISPMSSVEGYLYNFNLNVGDTLLSNYLTNSNSTMITRIDSILISGIYRKQFFVSVVDTNMWQWPTHYEYVSYIEGIGSTNGLRWTLMPYFERSGSLWAFKRNGGLEYTNSIATSCEVTGVDEIQQTNFSINIYPNPASNILNIQTSIAGQLNLVLVNLVGKEVLKTEARSNSSPNQISLEGIPDGIYVLNLFSDRKMYASVKLSVIKK